MAKKKRDVDEVIRDIILVGERLKWFVPLLKGNTPEIYINHQSGSIIYIDTVILKLFQTQKPQINNKYTDEELTKFLIEVIHKVVDGAKNYEIKVFTELAF